MTAHQVDVRIDLGSPVPLYFQLPEQLRAAITDGLLEPGERIENEIAIVERSQLSRPTAIDKTGPGHL